MWICSKLGFFSVVRKPGDLFHIRARVRKDLENLVDAVGSHRNWKITIHDSHETDPRADYAFRIVVPEKWWGAFGIILVESVDYANFKGIVGATPDQRERLPIYSRFHHEMERFQNNPDPVDIPDEGQRYFPPRPGF